MEKRNMDLYMNDLMQGCQTYDLRYEKNKQN